MKVYLRLLKYIIPYTYAFVGAIICMIVFAVTNGLMAYLIGPVFQFLFSEGKADVRLLPFGLVNLPREGMVAIIPLVIIVVVFIKGVSFFGQRYLMGYVGQRTVADLRTKLYRHILNLKVNYFTNTTTGTIISRVTNDTNLLQNTTVDALSSVLREFLTIIVLAAIVIGSDWKLALASFVAFPLAIYPMMRFAKKMKNLSRQGQVTMGNMTALLHEAIAGVRIVKAFCMEKYESMRFTDENERYTMLKLNEIKFKGISSPMMEMFGAIGLAATIWYAAYRIHNGTLEPGSFVSFFAAVLMLYRPIKTLNGVNMNIHQGIAAAERVFEMMDVEVEGSDKAGAIEIDDVKASIEFKKVSFGYGNKQVIRNLDLAVKKGEGIAIVGASGAGKTTLVNLIPRFYDITDGAIAIDGVDIREIKLESLRSQIAVVTQNIILFNDTLKKNISYGDFNKTDDDIMAAAKAANAHTFIERLPEGYNTFIGEGGVKLSGGERQRISIARAILKNAPILILDEATSSLDIESELEVQKGLNNLMKDRTAFVIAHRLSTVRNADRIIVLSDGAIKEAGVHDELLNLGGEYSRLYEMQFSSLPDNAAR